MQPEQEVKKKKSRNSTSLWLTGAINCRHKPSFSIQNNNKTINTSNFYASNDCILESSKLNAIFSQAQYETLALGCKSRSNILVDILVSDVFSISFWPQKSNIRWALHAVCYRFYTISHCFKKHWQQMQMTLIISTVQCWHVDDLWPMNPPKNNFIQITPLMQTALHKL